MSINPTIPSPLDFEFLLPAVQALCDGIVNGTYREMMQYVTTTLVPKFYSKIGKGEQATSYHVTRRKV
jgi:hypothetical protein